jgi:hypothetical protein
MLSQVVLHIYAFTQHMSDTVTAVVRAEIVILPQKGGSTHARRNSTFRRMVKAYQFTLHHAPVHHLVIMISAD